MAGRVLKRAKLVSSLQRSITADIEYEFIVGLEARNCSNPFGSVESRCTFSIFTGTGPNSAQKKGNVKPPVADTRRIKLLAASFDTIVHSTRSSKYWPSSWFNPYAAVLQDEKEKLNCESWAGKKSWSSRRLDLGHSRPDRVIRRNYKINGEKPSVLDGGVKYNIVRIDSDGTLQPLELKSSELGLHPRDIDLLSSGTFIPQRATLAVRHGLILVRMENVRAIVCKAHVLLFDARHPRGHSNLQFWKPSDRGASEKHRARDAFAQTLAEEAKRHPSSLIDPMPFHLRMVECLLEETSNFFHQKVDRLKLVVERMLEELTEDVSMGGLQRLLPLRRAVTEVEHDVRDAHEAMDQVLRSDDNLLALCLCRPARFKKMQPTADLDPPEHAVEMEDSRHHPMKQAAADMLLTYQREVDDAGGVLEELRKGMEAAQEIWELGLDTTRNRIMRMNLYISVTTFSAALAALPGSFFGMNLPSGFEEHPTLFYWVVGGATFAPLALGIGVLVGIRLWPRQVDQRRAQDLAGLRDLLQHLDSIDDIIQDGLLEADEWQCPKHKQNDRKRDHE
ncbi:hypothetical protein R1sor_005646 [Riccia sorocarpa]|uniref:Magnesium transporter n=1 Tax=Riccia sorocarpa TaxID=122646 RepID=A0ABD3HK48_9MARC